jgi:TolB-like protein
LTNGKLARCFARHLAIDLLESREAALAFRNHPSPARPRSAMSGKLAVLELRNFTDLSKQNAQYFTDVVRQAALKAQPQLQVMTRENLMVLLESTGRKLEECEGECEVDTGRRIGADTIVSGEIQKVGTRYKLTLRLHDTHEGRLLASAIGSGKSIDELDESAQKAAEELFTVR